MAKLLENERLVKKFYKYITSGDLKKLNAILKSEEGNFENEYLDTEFLKSYLTSNSYNGNIFKRVIDIPSIFIDVKFNEDFIFKNFYKRDKDVFFYAFKQGKINITAPLLQRIFEDDRAFFLHIIEIDDSLGMGILNDLIIGNDTFAFKVIEHIKKIEKSHLDNAMKNNVKPEFLEELLKHDKQNINFDYHQRGLLIKALKNLEDDVINGGGNTEYDVEKIKVIFDYADISDEEYNTFISELCKAFSNPKYSFIFHLLKSSGACNKFVEGYLAHEFKISNEEFDIFSLAGKDFKPEKKTVEVLFERGDFLKALQMKDKLNINLNDYQKEIHLGINGLIKDLHFFGDEKICHLAENLHKFAKETKYFDLEGEELVGQLSEVEKSRYNWKKGIKMFKFCLYNITDNYGSYSSKVVADVLIGGEKWYHILNKNIDLSDCKMQEVVWGIVENNARYGFNKKILEKIFNLKGFSLNCEQADFLLFKGAINIFDEDVKNNLIEQKKYFNFLINNKKINKINGINWAYLLKQKGVKQDDEIYQKILTLAHENNYKFIDEEKDNI